jgi:hypothetical protein
MKTRISNLSSGFLLLLLFAGCVTHPSERLFNFRIPTEQLPSGARVVGLSLVLTNACFASLPEAPVGWSFEVYNDPIWAGHIDGQIVVGAAALEKNDVFFQHPMVIRFNEDEMSDASCKIVLKTTEDFDPDNIKEIVALVPIRRF